MREAIKMIDVTNLKLTHPNDDGWLNDALSSDKNGTLLLSYMKPRLISDYSEYDKIITQYNKKPKDSIFLSHVKFLNGFYTDAPKKINDKKIDRRENVDIEQCPFCGNPVSPEILDHFLPKNLWPEFSIYPNNLVNQCDNCSSKKWKHYYCDERNVSKFIHPIYTNILVYTEFVFKIVDFNEDNPSIPNISLSIKIRKKLPKKQRRRIRLHLELLDVKNYALKHARKKYQKRVREIIRGKFSVLDLMNIRVDQHSKKIDNHWDVCLYKAMFNNQDFMSFLHREGGG